MFGRTVVAIASVMLMLAGCAAGDGSYNRTVEAPVDEVYRTFVRELNVGQPPSDSPIRFKGKRVAGESLVMRILEGKHELIAVALQFEGVGDQQTRVRMTTQTNPDFAELRASGKISDDGAALLAAFQPMLEPAIEYAALKVEVDHAADNDLPTAAALKARLRVAERERRREWVRRESRDSI